MTDAGRFTVIRRTFEQALERDVAERETFVTRACGADADLLAEVQRLLAAHSDDGFLVAPEAIELRAALTPEAPLGAPGERLAGYEVVRVLAEGGMGTVYEALQESPRRRVALKVMRTGLGSPSARRRFQYEVDVLARLRHPNIAQVHAAGTLDAGPLATGQGDDSSFAVPWFAMELVEDASTIIRYCRDHDLDLPARLRLFSDVCAAIHFGHQHGVIHRDVKPGNVLVDASGCPKVIDFGVARATDGGDASATQHTRAGEVVGTLQSMAPEQLEGGEGRVDTRADVYSLGVVLFELLCGRPPHDMQGKSFTEIIALVRDRVPAAPSTYVDLPAELDWIVLRAIEKEPDRRYGSPRELADDIQRYLDDEPVLASPPSAAYRVRKFVQRHRVGVAAAAAILLLLVAGITGTSLGWLRAVEAGEEARVAQGEAEAARGEAEQALVHAEQEAAKANTVVGFMIDLFESPDPGIDGRDVKVVDALARAEAMAPEAFRRFPGVESALRHALGKLYYNLGLLEQAEAHLIVARSLRETQYGVADGRTLSTVGALGLVWMDQGRYEESEAVFTPVLQLAREAEGDAAPAALAIFNNLAMLRQNQSRWGEAESLYRESVDAHREALGPEHPSSLASRANLGSVLLELQRSDEADQVLTPLVPVMERVLGPEHPRTLTAASNLGVLRMQQQRYDEARDRLRRVIDVRRRVMPEHPVLLAELSNLGALSMFQGDLEQAEALLLEVADVREQRFPVSDPDTLVVLSNLYFVRDERGDLEGCEQILERILAHDPGENVRLARGLVTLDRIANLCELRGRDAAVEAMLAEVLEGHARLLGPDHLDAMSPRLRHVLAIQRQGRLDEAERLLLALRDVLPGMLPDDHPGAAFVDMYYAGLLAEQGRFDEAEPLLLASHEVISRLGDAEERGTVLTHLVDFYERWGREVEAASWRGRL